MMAPELHGLRLDEVMPHRLRSMPQRDGSGESETAARQQAGVFVRRALPPTNVDEYLQICMKNQQRLAGIVGKVSFHDDEACTVPHGERGRPLWAHAKHRTTSPPPSFRQGRYSPPVSGNSC